jgi:hypothetical protein
MRVTPAFSAITRSGSDFGGGFSEPVGAASPRTEPEPEEGEEAEEAGEGIGDVEIFTDFT